MASIPPRSRLKKRFSIQAQLIALTVAFSLVIALIVCVSSMFTLYRNTRRSTLQAAEYGLQVAANNLRQNVQEIDDLANWCTVNATVQTYLFNPASSQRLLSNVYSVVSSKYSSLKTQRYLQRFVVTDGANQTLHFGTMSNQSRALTAKTLPLLYSLGEGEADTAWATIVSDPLMAAGTAVGIPITHTMHGTNGKTGRIYISVSTALFTDALRGYRLGEGDDLFFVMGSTLYRLGGDKLEAMGQAAGFSGAPEKNSDVLDADTQIYQVDTDNGPKTVVVYPLELHGLYLAQSISTTGLWARLFALQAPVLASLFGIVLLGCVLAFLLRRVVARPIRALQRQLTIIADGNFTTDPGIEWNNELGDIGKGINSLSLSMNALMEKRIEDEKQKQDLEYRMLQNQINPHFIYNTLNSIKWMATIQHAPGIAECVTALSRLLKSVSKGNERLVPLSDEFALLNDYFTIQQYRYGGTITMDVCYIEDERLCQSCMIPRFTLQPLVENAIFHGIEPKGCAGDISLKVTLDHETGDVLILLADDGVGMTPAQISKALQEPGPEEAAAKFRHVGLWNVHKRLQYSFGPRYGLSIASTPGEGTTITVRLPGPTPPGTPKPAELPQKGENHDNDPVGR